MSGADLNERPDVTQGGDVAEGPDVTGLKEAEPGRGPAGEAEWDRSRAEEADRADPLAPFRDLFLVKPDGPIYLDGNSLGRQPVATAGVMASFLEQWAGELVGGWEQWACLPRQVGDRVATLVGAGAGQVVVCDCTTVNLYKLAAAALAHQPGRPVLVGDAHDFPTVRYVLQGLAADAGHELRLIDSDRAEGPRPEEVAQVVDDGVALVCLSAVNFRSGAVADMTAVNRVAHSAGALTLWDLCHAAGVVPVDLDGSGADMAVGCGYKYLNGGPGAPSWLYVRSGLQAALRQPIWGWWGQTDQFEMGPAYDPVPSVDRFLTGSPPVMGMLALDAGIAPLVAAGVPAIWEKTRRLVDLLACRAEQLLGPLGATVASPRAPAHRGGHLAISHPHSWAAARLLIERDLVVPDFRPPDVLRLAPVALYTRFADVYEAIDRIASVLASAEVSRAVPKRRIT